MALAAANAQIIVPKAFNYPGFLPSFRGFNGVFNYPAYSPYYGARLAYEAPAVIPAPVAYQAPVAYEAPAVIPAPLAYKSALAYDAPIAYSAPAVIPAPIAAPVVVAPPAVEFAVPKA